MTLNGREWSDAAKRSPTERWINLYVEPAAMSDFTKDQYSALQKALVELGNGYKFIRGTIGVDGAYSSIEPGLGYSDKTAVFYFEKGSTQIAAKIADIVAKAFSLTTVKAEFVDPTTLDEWRRFAVERSGIDLQIYLRHIPK